MTKSDAVKKALEAGKDKPTDGVNWIKAELGMDVTTQQFSTYKSNLKAEGGTSSGGRKKGGRRKAAAAGTTVNNGLVAAGGIDVLDAMIAVKELCRRFGTEKVKKVVGLFE